MLVLIEFCLFLIRAKVKRAEIVHGSDTGLHVGAGEPFVGLTPFDGSHIQERLSGCDGRGGLFCSDRFRSQGSQTDGYDPG